jgi:uncharacterized damage-inducible protein DinB
MEPTELQDLLKHMEWADASTWKAVSAVQGAASDARIRELLYHVHIVQRAYLQVWHGQSPDVPALASFADLPAIAAWARPIYPELVAFAARTGSTQLSQELKVPWASELVKRYGTAAPATVGETVLQVILHSTHHRAQVASRVRELGGEPPLTDFISWVWRQRPGAEW